MKTNKKHIIIPALMMSVGVGLVGSISGTVAWYQYSTRVQTSYMSASAKCAENLQVSLTGEEGSFKSELTSAQIKAGAQLVDTADETKGKWDGSNFQPVTHGDGNATSGMYGHPIYQNFAYSTWQNAPKQSYLKYDLYFRVLDVDGGAYASYIAKKLYIEDITLQFQPAKSGEDVSAEEFKNAIRVSLENKTVAATHLLSNTARTDLPLGGEMDLNGDGANDTVKGYEFDANGDTQVLAEGTYGDESVTQTTKSFASYICPIDDNQLAPVTTGTNQTPVLGTTVAAAASTTASTYSKSAALHFEVKVWLEGWDNTQVWNAAKYIGNFQLGMRFGITNYGNA